MSDTLDTRTTAMRANARTPAITTSQFCPILPGAGLDLCSVPLSIIAILQREMKDKDAETGGG